MHTGAYLTLWAIGLGGALYGQSSFHCLSVVDPSLLRNGPRLINERSLLRLNTGTVNMFVAYTLRRLLEMESALRCPPRRAIH